MTFLITGSTGLVGQDLVRYLVNRTNYGKKTQKIRLLVRNGKDNPHRQQFLSWCESKEIDIFHGDLRNEISLNAFTSVSDPENSILVHCGAIFNFWEPYTLLYDVNVNGTERVLRAFHESKIRKLIFISSAAAYGEISKQNGFGVTENQSIDLNQKKGYELTKALSEDLVRQYMEINPDKSVTILRPSGIIGGSSSTMDLLSRMIFGRYVPLPRGGKDRISLVDAKDVARAIIFLFDFEKGNGEIYNVVGYTPILKEVMRELGYALQKENLSIIPIPLFVFKPMYYIARIIRRIKKTNEKSLLIPSLFDKLGKNIWIDERKLLSIGFKYHVTLSDSMEKFGNFVSENPWYIKEKLGFAL